eukprot:gb/GEZN01009593.1/.p1 GENE.gb/GEZN01009593.1/~~gb/GEZN01009593.1/.p1  ORF type:complete len:318 (-),score=59.91 gb/GEZN01009593.1/:274-1227(-)
MVYLQGLGIFGAMAIIVALLGPSGIHNVEEGHVGAYFMGGAIQPYISEPGYHWTSPLCSFVPIKVTLQTDTIRDIPCGTSGGVMIFFDKIEVVNVLKKELVYMTIKNYTTKYDQTWIHDKIHHLINEFCSSKTLQEVYIDHFDQLDEALRTKLQDVLAAWAPGIQIVAVRVTKPRIPDAIQKNYERMEEEKTKLLVAIQKQKVEEKEAQTAKKKAIIEAEKEQSVAKYAFEKAIYAKQSQQKMSAIEDMMMLEREKGFAEAKYYSVLKEAEADRLTLTKAYLELKKLEALMENSTFIYGDDIPDTLIDASVLMKQGL